MQFKSEKCWFSIGFRVLGTLSTLLFSASSASALTIGLASSGNGSASNNFYFPAKNSTNSVTASSSFYSGSGFTVLDLANDGTSTWDQIVFNVTTNQLSASSTPGQATVLVITVTGVSPGPTEPVAITAFQVGQSGNSPAQCYNSTNPTGACQAENGNYYHAVLLSSGSSYQVGLNMASLCAAYKVDTSASFSAQGCVSNLLQGGAGATTNTSIFALTFATYTMTLTGSNQLLWPMTLPTTPLESQIVTLNFSAETVSSSLSCPSTIPYTPADGSITVDTSSFSLGATSTPNGAADGLYQVIALGKKGATVDNSVVGTQAGGFDIVQGVSVSSGQSIGGFQNSSQSGAIPYAVGFIGLDNYGYLVANTTCKFPHSVETANIQGLLQSSKCFIATAAFRSARSAPVEMLRSFRDQILETFSTGRAFVRWYYRWSPGAANWLIKNPEFRFPVLLALVPVQTFVWLLLHPLFFYALWILGFGLCFFAFAQKDSSRLGSQR